jgi:hypothetical protein
MAGKSDYLENKVLDHILGNTAYSAPATLYIALFTAAPTDAGGGTEASASGYARVAVTNNTTNFPNAVGGTKSNGTAINFAAAGAPWGTVVAVAVFDALTLGNMLFWAPLTSSRTVNIGDVVGFSAGQLQFIED